MTPYQNRIQKAIAKGMTLQEARGHGAGEAPHRIRTIKNADGSVKGYTAGIHPEQTGKRYKGGEGASTSDLQNMLRKLDNGQSVTVAAYGQYYKSTNSKNFRWIGQVYKAGNLDQRITSDRKAGMSESEIAIDIFRLDPGNKPQIVQWSVIPSKE